MFQKLRGVTLNAAILIFVLSSVSSHAFGQECAKKEQSRDLKVVEDSFKKDFPLTQIREVRATDIEGLFEITARGNVFYYHLKSSQLFFGDLMTKDFNNVTAERRKEVAASWEKIIAARLKDLPLAKAIKIGSGKHVVIEFSDIDCPFCRNVEHIFKKYTDMTRYVFLFPLESIHPAAVKKATSVLCSKNRATAYADAMDGKLDSGDIKLCNDNKVAALLKEYKDIARTLEVDGTPAIWIDGRVIRGADVKKIESILTAGK